MSAPSSPNSLSEIPGLMRIETFSKDDMQAECMELTHAVYPHEQIYGKYCSLEAYVDCPPEVAFEYLKDPYHLGEWTYSMRDFAPTDDPEVLVSWDKIGEKTQIFTKTLSNADAMTVDFHCAWDQAQHLWMIYLMRVVPAQLVLNKPGCVILWSNCHHPFYENNPFPEAAPADRPVWVGDLWPFFYGGHHVELQNLKMILEHRAQQLEAAP